MFSDHMTYVLLFTRSNDQEKLLSYYDLFTTSEYYYSMDASPPSFPSSSSINPPPLYSPSRSNIDGDQLPISAVLRSAPIPYRVYSAPTFGIPDWSAIGQLLHVSCLPGSPNYFSIFPAVYPTSCQPSTATWLNDPRLSPSGLHSTIYWLLSPFDLVLQQLW